MEICAETERAGEVMRVEGQVRDRDARGDATTGRDDGNERDETRSSFRRDAVVRRVRESRASPYLPRTRERRRGVRLDALRRGPRSRRRRRPEQVHRVVVAPAHHAVGTADLDAW